MAYAALAVGAALTPLASAQTTTWFYGGTNNSATFGVTADSSQAITWQDSWAAADTFANSNYFGTESLQVNRPDALGIEQGIAMYGFGGTGLNAADVTSALLYLRSDFSFPTGSPNTWNIVGIANGNTSWDTSTMTWNDINGGAAGDWTGGTLGASLAGNFGSFQDLGTSNDTNIAIDITSALQAYLAGSISGIAFVNSTTGDTFSANDYAFVPFSNDNTTATNRPGLLVTTQVIPEPSSVLLGLLGTLALVRRRRC